MRNILKMVLTMFLMVTLVIPAIAQDDDFSKLAGKILENDVQGLADLIDSGYGVDARNSSGATPLILACSFKDKMDIIKLLVSKGADVNAKGFEDGKTPLMWAARTSYDYTEFLLSKGAETNVIANDGVTAFISALFGVFRGNDFSTLELLIDHGANINLNKLTDGANGYSALAYAARNGGKDLVKFLLDNGAMVNQRTAEGDTPLIIAVEEGKRDVVELLLKNGADKHIRNFSDQTAYSVAIESGHDDIAALLK